MARFADRAHAGRVLAAALGHYAGRPDLIVLGLPRGGVPVAFEVARKLGAPLDVFVVRKLGVPGREELAMGAVASGGVRVLNEDVVESLRIPPSVIDQVAAREERELARREQLYRAGLPPLTFAGKTAILVDDGLATGSTMRAAILAARRLEPAAVVVAVPVGSPDVCADLRTLADEVICAETPPFLYAVGLWYRDFTQVSDEEVRDLLARARTAVRNAET
ncbi:MAG: phosphoribosyltransferase [Chloroflexota bacterium]|nr:phosphoribosyltransferase [Dehalococcoidia bacterium]MDW8254666.1 phosphoribosyltransferase [Chloroflexota bacterium]